MDNQAQMKQELEYWEQADAQRSTSDTLPIPQQNQQSDIQPMFEIRRHIVRKHSTANQHINTTPRRPAELQQPLAPSQYSGQRRYKEAPPNVPRRRYNEPHQNNRQNTAPHQNPNIRQNPHIRQNPRTLQAGVRMQNRNADYGIQQPPYMPQPYNQASYAPAKTNSTRQNPYAQQYTNASRQPYMQTPIGQPHNPKTRQTANLPQNTNKNRKNPPQKAAPPRGQDSKKIQRIATPTKRKNILLQSLAILMILVIPVTVFLWIKFVKPEPPVTAKPTTGQTITVQEEIQKESANHPPIEENFLTISEYNRPGTKLASVKNIFVHYTANPGTTAAQNRSYFENLGETHERSASAHFIIGCEGEVIQCIPLEEEAYAVIGRNNDSISIECCYQNENGKFTQATYDSLISMLAWLTKEYQLEPTDILRHYDCGGKRCPLYYVDHEDAWLKLLEDVSNYSDNT